jgi:dethiobiotin synthetase
MQPFKGLFVTGTDTGVGKTVISTSLVRLARRRGVNAVGIKPVETGCDWKAGVLHPEDGALLTAASDNEISLDEVTPFRFSLPASPARAAAMEGRKLMLADIVAHISAIAESAEMVIVEGAGGLMVPIQENLMMIDMVERLGFPVVLVARMRIGTINHTLLSVSALEARSLGIAGIVLSCSSREFGPEEEHTAGDIARLVKHIPVAVTPFLDENVLAHPDSIADAIQASWPKEFLSRLLG